MSTPIDTKREEKIKARLVKCEEYIDKSLNYFNRLPLSVSDTASDLIDNILEDVERLEEKGYNVDALMAEINRLDEKVSTLDH